MIAKAGTILWMAAAAVLAQNPPERLTLQEAERIALRNNPHIAAAEMQARATAETPAGIRSALYPNVSFNVTGAGAPEDTRLAAGGINNPVIYSRFASGVSATQLITDFGRTSALAQSAALRANSAFEAHKATRADTLLAVERAYYAGLRARATLAAAERTVAARGAIVDYTRALAASKLKSELDVRFAEVSLAEARLLAETAGNDRRAADADLSMALGYAGSRSFELVDEPARELPSTDVRRLVADALARRPELAGIRFDVEAAVRMVEAEKKLRFPSVAAVASAGAIPAHVNGLANNHYAAVGLNVSIPFLNGGQYAARRREAEYRAQASRQRLKQAEQAIARDVSLALINAQSAAQRIALTSRLVEQAGLALELAQARYDLGLSSIVELSQAQVAQTSAEIQSINANYDYRLQRATLAHHIGELR